MTLPPKAINVLANFKELLSSDSDAVANPESEGRVLEAEAERKPLRTGQGSPRDGKEPVMRHARQRGMGYQRYKQRGGW